MYSPLPDLDKLCSRAISSTSDFKIGQSSIAGSSEISSSSALSLVILALHADDANMYNRIASWTLLLIAASPSSAWR